MLSQSVQECRKMKRSFVIVAGLVTVLASGLVYADVVDFEEFSGVYYGADGAGGFNSYGAQFNNTYTDWGGGAYSWAGWAYSDATDTTTPGFENQYSAVTGGGASNSASYGVAYFLEYADYRPVIELPAGCTAESMMVTNTTYAALAMVNGEYPAKKFGGVDGNDEDYFKLIITGLDDGGSAVGTQSFYLADYRFADNSQDYIVDEWTMIDLTSLTGARKLEFSFESSDVGGYGINTPTYVAMDNLVITPEPGTMILLLGASLVILRKR